MLFLQFILYPLSFVGTLKSEIPEAALELFQLKIKQPSPDILKFRTKLEDNPFTLNCSVALSSFCLYFMQTRMHWILIILGTQVITKKWPVRFGRCFRFLWLWFTWDSSHRFVKYRFIRYTFRFVRYRYPSKHFICLQDILKMSSRHVFRRSSRHVFKKSWRRLHCNKFLSSKTSSRRLCKTSSRGFEDILEVEKLLRWRCVAHVFKRYLEVILKTSWRPANICWDISHSSKMVASEVRVNGCCWS